MGVRQEWGFARGGVRQRLIFVFNKVETTFLSVFEDVCYSKLFLK